MYMYSTNTCLNNYMVSIFVQFHLFPSSYRHPVSRVHSKGLLSPDKLPKTLLLLRIGPQEQGLEGPLLLQFSVCAKPKNLHHFLLMFIDGRTGVKPYSYLPFGVGPRTCIGNKFAMMEMKVILATLLKSFSFSEVPGCTVKAVPALTTHPKGLKLFIRLVDSDN